MTTTTETHLERAVSIFTRHNPWFRMADADTSTAIHLRIHRALAINPRYLCQSLHPNGLGTYSIASTSSPGVIYVVNLEKGCSCPDSQNRAPMGWCKHRLALWLFLLKENGPRSHPEA